MREGRLCGCVVTGTSRCSFTRPTVWGCVDIFRMGKAQRTRQGLAPRSRPRTAWSPDPVVIPVCAGMMVLVCPRFHRYHASYARK
jgi:hypothetical protein